MSHPLVIEKQVAAPPDRVYEVWTSPERLARWWWPHLTDTTYEVDAHVGGTYRIESRSAGIGVTGQFTRLEPPDEIVMTWNWENDGVSTVRETVSVRFDPDAQGTLLRVVHMVDEIAGDAESLRQGWESVLGRLAEYFS